MVQSNPYRNESTSIRVLIVDDEDAIRTALPVLLRDYEDVRVVGVADSGEQAVRLCGEAQPHVVLMELRMPVTDGITATRLIKSQHPQVQIIALSTTSDRDLAGQAIRAGAFMYLSKTVTLEKLVRSIRAANRARLRLMGSKCAAYPE